MKRTEKGYGTTCETGLNPERTNAEATAQVNGGLDPEKVERLRDRYHEFEEFDSDYYKAKRGASRYLIDKETGERFGPGSHEIWKTWRGYRGRTGGRTYWIKNESPLKGLKQKIGSILETGEEAIKTYLEADQERETVMETKVGIPGLKAYRTVEKYDSGEGYPISERRTELRILGLPFTLDYGEVEGEVIDKIEPEQFTE